jgi:miniconductance mechanosensitive channel
MEDEMQDQIYRWLLSIGLNEGTAFQVSQVLLIIAILAATSLLQYLTRLFIRRALKKWLEKTETYWDDVFYKSDFFIRLANIPPVVLLYFSAALIPNLTDWIQRIALALIAFTSTYALTAALTAINDIYDDYAVAKSKPIKGYIQVGKIILWLFGLILIVSALLRSSPILLMGGLGAFSAVLLLVFRDTLLGLFASVQFVTNDMIRIGDWIEMPEYNADGEVFDISVHTVKVSNWDKTISTIPTYALMANSFKNWRGMELSGGRRIKRAIHIDLNSIRFCDQALLAYLSKIKYIQDYLYMKKDESIERGLSHHVDSADIFAGHNITNLGAFRAYIFGYLKNHPKINPDMEILVRHMAPTQNGLPLEIYAFSKDKRWEDFEDNQAEIFDHLLAILPEFDLAAYQNASGMDIRSLQQFQVGQKLFVH